MTHNPLQARHPRGADARSSSEIRGLAVLVIAAACSSVVACSSSRSPLASDRDAEAKSSDADVERACAASCRRVESPAAPPPYGVSFRFRNRGATPVYLRDGCLPEYGLSSCARCYADDLGPTISCGQCRCDDSSCRPGGVACGACPPERGTPVAPGGFVDHGWGGFALRDDDVQGQCFAPLPAGYYGLRVKVYASEEDALARTNGREVKVEFPLGTGMGVVEVDVTAP